MILVVVVKCKIFHPPDLSKLAGYALPYDVSSCTRFLAFFHHQHGTSVPSSTYSLWGCRSLGCGGGGNTTSRMFNTVLIALEIVG